MAATKIKSECGCIILVELGLEGSHIQIFPEVQKLCPSHSSVMITNFTDECNEEIDDLLKSFRQKFKERIA